MRQTVCIQGLGFVGAAMAAALASATVDNQPCFEVVGVDLPTPLGNERIAAINRGEFPFRSSDPSLADAVQAAHRRGNLRATCDPRAFAEAGVIVVDVNLDLVSGAAAPAVHFEGFRRAIRAIGQNMSPGTLVVVETTVPPGTTALVVAPELEHTLAERGLAADAFLLAHSYERVMPGADYLNSIVNYWRVFAGHTEAAADAAQQFLSQFINVRDYPLTRLASTTASETAKVLENSYRAVNIAFIEEWARFAESVDVDLFSVIDVVRQRPTHANIRQPGFGVGGYCLTKDPLFALAAARDLWNRPDLQFPFCERAVSVNSAMPLVTLDRLDQSLHGLGGRRVLLLGVSYRQDVGDTRNSPSEVFYRAAMARGAQVTCHDPLVEFWPEVSLDVAGGLPRPGGFDAVVFAVPHREYQTLDMAAWLDGARPLVFDANRVLSGQQMNAARTSGCTVVSIGRGDGS